MDNAKRDALIEAGHEQKKSKSHGRAQHAGLDSAAGSMNPRIPPVHEKRVQKGDAPPAAEHLKNTHAHLGNKASHGVAPSHRDRNVLAAHLNANGQHPKGAHAIADGYGAQAKSAQMDACK